MVRVVNCYAGVLGSNPGGPKDFPLGITSDCTMIVGPNEDRVHGATST